MVSNTDLYKILKIAFDISGDGEGVSLNTAIRRSNYVQLRSQFNYQDLIPIIEANPELVGEWRLQMENKRTDGGFRFGDGVIGTTEKYSVERSSNLNELVAKYVVLELDFWAQFQ